MAGGTGGIGVQHAGGGIAAGVGAVVRQATVALLPGLHKAVATHRGVEQAGGFVAQAVVHGALEGQSQVLVAAAAPVCGAVRPEKKEL